MNCIHSLCGGVITHPYPHFSNVEVDTLRPKQNGRHLPNDIFKYIFLNENARISIEMSLKFAPNGPINNIPALVRIMAWRRPGDKPLSEPMVASLLTHIYVTQPQWVKEYINIYIPTFYEDVITYPCPNLNTHV